MMTFLFYNTKEGFQVEMINSLFQIIIPADLVLIMSHLALTKKHNLCFLVLLIFKAEL